MIASTPQRAGGRRIRNVASHLFAVGQTVRMKRRFGASPRIAEIYHVTGTLPPIDNTLQYRIRNDDERHERVVTEDSLESIAASPADEDATLLERTFGNGQGTKTQQSRGSEAEAGEESPASG